VKGFEHIIMDYQALLDINPLFTHCRIVNRNSTSKMALLLYFVKGGVHTLP